MDTLQEKEAMQNLPFREDGTIDLVELGRRQLEAMVNQIMDWQADELCAEGDCSLGTAIKLTCVLRFDATHGL